MSHPHRTLDSVLVNGDNAGRWYPLGQTMSLPPEGGKFIGHTSGGSTLLADGGNIEGMLFGFADVACPNYTQQNVHERAANPDYEYTADQKVFIITSRAAVFRLQVAGSVAIADLIPGKAYGLIVEDGVQKLNSDDTANGVVVITDKDTDASRGWVRVKMR